MAPRGHTVFVLGAGASLAEALHHRPKRSREHPPLDANLFRQKKRYREDGLYRRVQAQATKLGVADLARESPPVGLEDYLGRLYFNVQHNPAQATVRAYFELIDLYAWEVVETTRWMVGRRGLIKRVLQREIARGNRITVITFNIDLLIENALQELVHSRPSARLDLALAYGFLDPLTPLIPQGDSFDFGGGVSDIPLLKMHGSVNWLFKTRDYYPPADLVSEARELYVLREKSVPPRRLRVRLNPGGRAWYAFPLIVPPIYEKHAFIRTHLQDVWDGAEAALLSADQVVLWGYSFPSADTHARHFFQSVADRNPALRSPVIINPDLAVASALWSLLRVERVTQFRDAEKYLA